MDPSRYIGDASVRIKAAAPPPVGVPKVNIGADGTDQKTESRRLMQSAIVKEFDIAQ
jgi:hypothetical protein